MLPFCRMISLKLNWEDMSWTELNVIRRELRALGITRRCRCYGRIVMAIQLAVDQEDSLEAVHLTETEALEVTSRVENSKVECRAKIRATDVQTVPAVQL